MAASLPTSHRMALRCALAAALLLPVLSACASDDVTVVGRSSAPSASATIAASSISPSTTEQTPEPSSPSTSSVSLPAPADLPADAQWAEDKKHKIRFAVPKDYLVLSDADVTDPARKKTLTAELTKRGLDPEKVFSRMSKAPGVYALGYVERSSHLAPYLRVDPKEWDAAEGRMDDARAREYVGEVKGSVFGQRRSVTAPLGDGTAVDYSRTLDGQKSYCLDIGVVIRDDASVWVESEAGTKGEVDRLGKMYLKTLSWLPGAAPSA